MDRPELPNEFEVVELIVDIIPVHDGVSMEDILFAYKEIFTTHPEVKPSEVFLDEDYDEDSIYSDHRLVMKRQVPNTNYAREMEDYHRQMAEFMRIEREEQERFDGVMRRQSEVRLARLDYKEQQHQIRLQNRILKMGIE